LHDLAGEPARDHANQQYDKQTFTRHIHDGFLPVEAKRWQSPLVITRASFPGIEDFVQLLQIFALKKLPGNIQREDILEPAATARLYHIDH
jgi:hypothetical protein